MSRLGDMIRLERNRKGLELKEVARKSGVTVSFLLDVEQGKKIINDTTASRILKVMGASGNIADEFEDAKEEQRSAAVPQKTAAPVIRRTTLTEPVQPNEQWQDALSSIIKRVPVMDISMTVLEYKSFAVQGGKIEGYHPDKVFYLSMPDNSLSGFRIRRGDQVFIIPVHQIMSNSIMLVEWKGRRALRRIKKMEGNKVLLMTHDREPETEVVEQRDLTILGQALRVEFQLA